MTARGGYKPREAGSLKEAVAALVQACGGQRKASELSRVSTSQIARYTDDSDENRFVQMPVDIVMLLEAHCGRPVVTEYLAAQAGGLFVPLQSDDAQPYAKLLAAIGREQGTFFEEACGAIADGTISTSEAGKVMREALRLSSAIATLIGDLRALLGGRSAP